MTTIKNFTFALALTFFAAALSVRAHTPSVGELAESGTSEQTILAIAGHVSRRMLERYIRMETKRSALEAISQQSPKGYGTKNGTKAARSIPEPQFQAQKW